MMPHDALFIAETKERICCQYPPPKRHNHRWRKIFRQGDFIKKTYKYELEYC